MTNWNGNGGSWGVDAPVFSTSRDYEADSARNPYPDVWITRQIREPTDDATGRNCIWRYSPDGDPEGWEALDLGGTYYDEGMDCTDEDEHEKRVLCFQAAELLYLHASSKGNPVADLCLGYVYSYDRCEGEYWENRITWERLMSCETEEELHRPYPHMQKAVEHYRRAAEAGIPEACYKYGDLLRDGRGCEVDLPAAYSWFRKAYDGGLHDRPVIWGSAALRLGACHEEGLGCEQSFVEAKLWYERAVAGLGAAVDAGDTWYRGALRRAERGLTRCKQELAGSF